LTNRLFALYSLIVVQIGRKRIFLLDKRIKMC
jgi:hypothetical protein